MIAVFGPTTYVHLDTTYISVVANADCCTTSTASVQRDWAWTFPSFTVEIDAIAWMKRERAKESARIASRLEPKPLLTKWIGRISSRLLLMRSIVEWARNKRKKWRKRICRGG